MTATRPGPVSSVSLDLSWAPDACTLPTAERPLREREFTELFRSRLVSASIMTPTTAELVLTGDRGRIADLVARETACCSFFEFTLHDLPAGRVGVRITVPDRRTEVLTALVQAATQSALIGDGHDSHRTGPRAHREEVD